MFLEIFFSWSFFLVFPTFNVFFFCQRNFKTRAEKFFKTKYHMILILHRFCYLYWVWGESNFFQKTHFFKTVPKLQRFEMSQYFSLGNFGNVGNIRILYNLCILCTFAFFAVSAFFHFFAFVFHLLFRFFCFLCILWVLCIF